MNARATAAVVGVVLAALAYGCGPTSDAQPARWAVDPDWQPDPAATEIPLLLSEQSCHGYAPPDGRVVVRDIAYGLDVIVADIAVVPLPGAQTCPGPPPSPYVLHLDEPIDDREVLAPSGQRLTEGDPTTPPRD